MDECLKSEYVQKKKISIEPWVTSRRVYYIDFWCKIEKKYNFSLMSSSLPKKGIKKNSPRKGTNLKDDCNYR